jgi:folate-binding protein YgfZ
MFYAFLQNRAVISLSGDDSVDFLQGLISNDARRLLEDKPVYAALLSPQGRFLHDFFLVPVQGKILIDVQADRAKDLFSRLKLYRLRSKVEIMMDEQFLVAALWEGELDLPLPLDGKIYQDPRLLEMGYRFVGTQAALKELASQNKYSLAEEGGYENFRLSMAVPDTKDMIVEKSLLLECGFEELHGVDFSKGCYVGQEVTARSKFRGQVRKSF